MKFMKASSELQYCGCRRLDYYMIYIEDRLDLSARVWTCPEHGLIGVEAYQEVKND